MQVFVSDRERRLWLWTLVVVTGIYATLGLAGRLAGFLRQRGLLDAAFATSMVVIGLALLASVWRRGASRRELWVLMGVLAVATLVVVRMGIGPEERTHLIEYGLVAGLVHEALLERGRNGRPVPAAGALAVVVTGLLGWIDEGIQALMPSRVYDIRDVGFNALAAAMAVIGRTVVAYGRDRRR